MMKLHPQNPAIVTLNAHQVAKYTSIGGYPLFYICEDLATLCANCVQDNLDQCVDESSMWYIKSHEINWESPYVTCEHCGDKIEEAYPGEE